KKGKGFVGTHCASDTFHGRGDTVDPYIQMLGGEFISHGSQQVAKAICVDSRFPGFTVVKDGLELNEEWYSLKNFAPNLHVLLYQATWSLKNVGGNSVYRRAPFPSTWAHPYGKGRVFYTALGHREDVWTNPVFQSMLAGGIRWAAGDAKAEIRPNIKVVTPGF